MKARKLLLAWLILSAAALAGQDSPAQNPPLPPAGNPSRGPVPLLACKQAAPATVVQLAPASRPLLASLVLKNQGRAPIIGYRIGWLLSYAGKPRPVIGPLLHPAHPVAPGQTVPVKEQGSPEAMLRARPDSVTFFVAQVDFDNGTVWKPALQHLGCQ